jgi:hypothetical protein
MSTDDNTTNNKTHVSSKITEWLKDEGYSFEPYEKPYTDFCCLEMKINKQPVYVLMETDKKNSVMIYTGIDLSKLDRQAFASLQIEAKKEFIYALTSSLRSLNLHYNINPNAEQMENLRIISSLV